MLSRSERNSRAQFGATLAAALMLASCGTTPHRQAGMPPPPQRRPGEPVADLPMKIGKPYQIFGQWYYPTDDANYDQVGLASWYGDAFHGGATANGEIYDMNMVGAAHKTLPLPCYVEVTALGTGRTILVRINDRGPFVANRIIDLSRRAAEQLGIARTGVARVRVRRVYPSEADRLALRSGREVALRSPASTQMLASLNARLDAFSSGPVAPAQTNAVPLAGPPVSATEIPASSPAGMVPPLATSSGNASSPPAGSWFVQIGAFEDQARASGIAISTGARIESTGSLYRVRLGPYANAMLANAALARMRSEGYQGATLVRPTINN